MKTSFLHKTFAIAFIISFLVNVLLPSLVFVDFKLNQDFIAANLCVDKAIEESTCAGKCQLAKSLSKIQNNNPTEERQIETSIESHITSVYMEQIFELKFTLKEDKIKYARMNSSLFDSGIYATPFRPPILS